MVLGVGGLGQGLGRWGGVMFVCVVSLDYFIDGRSMYLYIVLGGYMRILGALIIIIIIIMYFYSASIQLPAQERFYE